MIRPRATSRLFASALALLAAAAPISSALHEAAVRHVACPEDGELIDAPAQAAHDHADAPGQGWFLFSERETSAHGQTGHEHCLISLQSHRQATQPLRSTAAVPAVAGRAAQPFPPQHPVLRLPVLYRLAPKASPPQA